jgi:hypothetical protein
MAMYARLPKIEAPAVNLLKDVDCAEPGGLEFEEHFLRG